MPLMETNQRRGRFGSEAVWVIGMTLLGAGLRLKGLGTLGLDHFDEGIYAQAATWIYAEGGLLAIDPGLVPYAPPGYPVLVGLLYAAIGVSGAAAILVSILAGVLTIPTLAWFSRRTFGPGAGAATATLSAMAGPHVVFSRTGLTDSTFLLAWSLALIAGARFLELPNGGRAAWLGLLVGLAQLVKYNGWMSGVIVAGTVVVGAIRPGDGRRMDPRTMGLGLVAAGVSALVYLPWFLFVEQTSGYSGLIAHHRSYVDGIAGWWPNWQQQMAQSWALSGRVRGGFSWLSISLGLAWIGCSIGQGGSPGTWGRFRQLGPIVSLALATASIAASPPNLCWWASLAWSPILLADRRPSVRLAGVWFLVMAASTPLYHPYARLWLPTLAASWVVSGGLIASVLEIFRWKVGSDRLANRLRRDPVAVASVVAMALALIGPRLLPDRVQWFPDLLARSDGIRTISERFRAGVTPSGPRISEYHLYARPPLRFYLLQMGAGPIAVHSDLESILGVPARSNSVAIVDSGMGVNAGALGMNDSDWIFNQSTEVPASIASVLDARPDCVYEPSARHLGSVPSVLNLRDPSGSGLAGSSIFWFLDAP
jgi:4-amino-4-deoxy-L-arabinose transferase-like glycosyltransferase